MQSPLCSIIQQNRTPTPLRQGTVAMQFSEDKGTPRGRGHGHGPGLGAVQLLAKAGIVEAPGPQAFGEIHTVISPKKCMQYCRGLDRPGHVGVQRPVTPRCRAVGARHGNRVASSAGEHESAVIAALALQG